MTTRAGQRITNDIDQRDSFLRGEISAVETRLLPQQAQTLDIASHLKRQQVRARLQAPELRFNRR